MRRNAVERPRESFGDSSTQAGMSYSSQGPLTQPLLTQSLPLSQQSSLPFSQQSDRGYNSYVNLKPLFVLVTNH